MAIGENQPPIEGGPKDNGHVWRMLTVALSVCLSLAFLDVLFLLTNRPGYFESSPLLHLFAATATSFGTLVVYYLLLLVVFSFTLGLRIGKKPTPRAAAVGVVLGVLIFLTQHVDITPDRFQLSQVVEKFPLQVMFFSIGGLAAVGSYVLVDRWARWPHATALYAVATVGAPLALGGAALLFWAGKARLGFSGDARLLSLLLAYVVILSSCLLLLYRFSRKLGPTRWMLGLVIVVLALGLTDVLVPRLDRASAPAGSVAPPGPRSVLLITADALRADHLSCLGSAVTSTPNLDRLAEDGVLFETLIAAAPYTLPSLASIMTGLPVAVHGIRLSDSRLPEGAATLAEYLQAAGWQTAGISFSPFSNPKHGLSQGFGEYRWFPRRPMWAELPLTKTLPRALFRRAAKARPSSRQQTDMAVRWLGKNRDGRVFLWIHYYDPHVPYAPPPEFLPDGPVPERIGTSFREAKDFRGGYFVPTREEKDWIKRLYAAEVNYLDSCIGQLVADLKRLNLYEDSLIVLTSDHGEEFWEHRGLEHGHSVYEEVIRVPLIVRFPGGPKGVRVATPVSGADIAPTILAACGIEWPYEGRLARNLLSFGDSPGVAASEGLLYYEDRRAIRRGRLKYVRWLDSGYEELYDLAGDPAETSSLVEHLPDELAAARAAWEDYERETAELSRQCAAQAPGKADLDREEAKRLRSLGYLR